MDSIRRIATAINTLEKSSSEKFNLPRISYEFGEEIWKVIIKDSKSYEFSYIKENKS